MTNKIRLLPDVLANQIAAGEVVQRPASAVKELLENAIDAGAQSITLVLKDGGKQLITVIDDGSGMSPIDARMSFERHATSKLSKVEDLFAIKTMGFRGEALASIAAVAQVEMITRRNEEELGTRILIEGARIISQESVQATVGTTITIKNLFFNIPARRIFLKSQEVEKKHAFEEFIRIALAHSGVKMVLYSNDELVYHLLPSNLKVRITGLFKQDISRHLLELDESTPEIQITGLVGTPDHTRKTRGDQYLFVNHRFIKSPFLQHAIMAAYEKMIPPEHYPFYILFIELDPAVIDINVHPTKQEIKFENEQVVYSFIRSAVKHTLSYNLVAPAIDFEKDTQLNAAWQAGRSPFAPLPSGPSSSGANSGDYRIPDKFYKENVGRWQDLYSNIDVNPVLKPDHSQNELVFSDFNLKTPETDQTGSEENRYFQVHGSFIFCQVKSGLLIIDQQNAHHRILYERFLDKTRDHNVLTQTDLFPQSIVFSSRVADMLGGILDKLAALGFDIERENDLSFKVHGYPSFMEENTDIRGCLEDLAGLLLEEKEFETDLVDALAISYADNNSITKGRVLRDREMTDLIEQLFSTREPAYTVKGKKIFQIMKLADLHNLINQ